MFLTNFLNLMQQEIQIVVWIAHQNNKMKQKRKNQAV